MSEYSVCSVVKNNYLEGKTVEVHKWGEDGNLDDETVSLGRTASQSRQPRRGDRHLGVYMASRKSFQAKEL